MSVIAVHGHDPNEGTFMSDFSRRTVVTSALGLAMMSQISAADVPAATTPKTEGKPDDFDFLTGEWRIHNRFLEGEKWIEFTGEATVVGILGGICSVEELRIPARKFSGMGLRILDVEKKVWSDHWVNAKSGVVTVPGQMGVFVDGVGTFTSEDKDERGPVIYRGVWDRITPTSCRWYQSWSRDAGKSWNDTWLMDWTRA
jgi:hypothetical protein